MNGNVVYVGIDVDDVQYHGSALDRQTGEVLGFQCRPTLKGLIGRGMCGGTCCRCRAFPRRWSVSTSFVSETAHPAAADGSVPGCRGERLLIQ